MTVGPVSPVPREARSYQGSRAGLVTRMIAAVIDGLVVAAVLVAGYLGFAGLMFMLDPRGFSFPSTSILLSLAAGFVISILYLTAGWATSGRTYGCHVMGLRVVNFRGERLHVAGAFVRAGLCTALPIGLLWCAASRANRSLQDVLLRSSVVYDWQPRPPWRRPAQPDDAGGGSLATDDAAPT